jgi:urea carboxylase-associated protein 1
MAGILLEKENATPEQRAALARALASTMRPIALKRMAEMEKRNGERKRSAALRIDGHLISDEVVNTEANYYAREVTRGTHLRIIDLGGQQAVDFLCFDLSNTEIRYNAANTIKLNRGIYVTAGYKLYSDIAEVLMSVAADTVGGHDTIGGACSNQVNYLRYGIPYTHSCRDNFLAALKERGMSARDIHANINWFMNVPVHPDGSAQIEDGKSEPGDYVDLRAEKDVLVVMSNCPQFYNPCSGWNPTPIRVIQWRKHQDQPLVGF